MACGTTAPLTTTVTRTDGSTGVPEERGLGGTVASSDLGGATTDDGGSLAATGTAATASGGAGAAGGAGGTRAAPTRSGATGAGSAANADAPASGGSAPVPTGPIKVGILIHDFTALVKAVGGGSNSNTDSAGLNRAVIKGINARGGLAGRQIEPVIYTVDGSASDYSSQYQAACDTFTKDDPVEVVVGGGASDIFYSCLMKAGIVVMAANPTEGTDDKGMSAFPNVFNPPGMATDRQASALITQSIANGWLTNKNRLGVLVSGCDWGARVYNGVIVPAAKKHGIPVEQFSLGCPTPGSASLSSYSGSIQSAALQFRGNGVDRVMFAAGHGDAASYVFFTRNADSQRWFPGYLAGTNAVAQAWTASGVVSAQQAANTRGIGWIPVVDSSEKIETDATRACVELVQAGGAPPPPDPPTAGNYYMLCDGFLPLRAALEATGGAAGLATLRPALERLGSSYTAASVVSGATMLSAERHDGARNAAFFAYVTECSCFRYTGSPQGA